MGLTVKLLRRKKKTLSKMTEKGLRSWKNCVTLKDNNAARKIELVLIKKIRKSERKLKILRGLTKEEIERIVRI